MANHLFDAICQAIPSRESALIEAESNRIWTYGDMLDCSARIANLLVRFGITPGDRVAAQVEKSAEALMLYLACVRAGAVYLPLNNAYTAAELEYFIGDATPKLVVVSPQSTAQLASIADRANARLETLDMQGGGSLMLLADTEPSTFSNTERQADDLAAILYTSGTTGRSKGAMLTHANLLSNATVLQKLWHFEQHDKLIHALPIFHTHGLFVAFNVTLLAGSSIYLLSKFDLDQIFSLLPQATVMMGVPTFYTRLLKDPRLTHVVTDHMRLFVSGSAPLLAETHHAFKQRTGHAILERYGMTETNMITSNPYDGLRQPGSVGYPLPGVSVRVADPVTGALQGAGQPGVLEVKGPNVFKGYWNMPEKTREEFRPDGYFITGDICVMDSDGRVAIIGRAKDLIISGGYNIYPKEIENEIDVIAGTVESAVIGVPHPDLGEAVVAIVVGQPGADIDASMVMRSLETRLARFKQPKHVIFVDDLPRNTMGKVQKNLLRDQHRDLFS
ncbi:MAG TPA: malonyl-CoA synthase [Ochrobactrum sp.]|nr:malonyl-CoA synthase [Ochrobactrum sp.]